MTSTLAAAGIDVFDETPLHPNHPLRLPRNAVLTPHAAFHTEESLSEIRKRAIDALRVLRGDHPRYPAP